MTDQVRATKTDWSWLERIHRKADTYMSEPHICNISIASCLVELRDRVVALEAAGGVAGNPGNAPAAPAGVTIHELTRALERIGCDSTHAQFMWNDYRIGPLLRGEGAAAPKRVVLPKHLPYPSFYGGGEWYEDGWDSAWAAARAEVERQQQAGQADG